MAIEVGQALLHRRLIEKIGEGGMGEISKALDATPGRIGPDVGSITLIRNRTVTPSTD